MTRRPVSTLTAAAGLVALLAGAAAASAGKPAPLSTALSRENNVTVPAIRDGALQLSLEEAIAIALEQNLGLDVERYNRAISLFRVNQNYGIYDLNTTANANLFLGESFSTNALAGNAAVVESEGQSVDFGVSQLFDFGGTASVGFDLGRDDFSVAPLGGGPGATFPTSWTSALQVGFRQPLLRGFGKLPTERNILVARYASDASREQFETQVANTIQAVVATYFDLVEAIAQVQVSEEGLKLARDLHGMNKIRVDVGTLAPLELVQSEVGIATREEEIIRTRYAVGNASDALRRLLNLEGEAYWSAEIRPITAPDVSHVDIRLEEAIKDALANRPELEQQRIQLASLKVDQAFFTDQLKPRLDLTAGYGFNGAGLESDGYSDALQQITDRDLKGWSVGVAFAYPLQNRAARAGKTIADLSHDQAATVLADLEQAVITEVRQAVRNLETAEKAVESARVSKRLAEKNLDAERKRYENGLSTSFQVLEIQEDLTAAASREVNAVGAYRRSLTAYYKAIGRLLPEADVELTDDVERIQAGVAAK